MSIKRVKCLVCRVLFALGLIKACKAPPLPTNVASKKSSKKKSK